MQGVVAGLQTSPAVSGTMAVSSDLARDPYITSSDTLQRELEGLVSRRLAAAREGTLAGLTEAQAATGARGGESALLRGGADFGSRTALADALAGLRIDQMNRRSQDIQNALQAQGMASDTLNRAVLGPQALLQQTYGSSTAPATASFIGQLQNLGLLSGQDALREAASSALQNTIAPIAGLAGAVSGIFGTGGLWGEKGVFG
jgi:hypothetical protein